MLDWKPIKGFEGLYEISNAGNIRSFHSREAKTLKTWESKDGYIRVSLRKNSKIYSKLVHRLVAKTFIPNPENKPQVNHIDGDKTNNKIDNLEWCTAKENIQHAYDTGLHKLLKGKNNPNYGNKLSEEAKKKISEANKGKHHTDEAREKMSRARRGKKNPQARQVRCITTDEIFNCIIEGATKYNANAGCISECCKGKRKSAGKHPTTGEKLVWQYTETI